MEKWVKMHVTVLQKDTTYKILVYYLSRSYKYVNVSM